MKLAISSAFEHTLICRIVLYRIVDVVRELAVRELAYSRVVYSKWKADIYPA